MYCLQLSRKANEVSMDMFHELRFKVDPKWWEDDSLFCQSSNANGLQLQSGQNVIRHRDIHNQCVTEYEAETCEVNTRLLHKNLIFETGGSAWRKSKLWRLFISSLVSPSFWSDTSSGPQCSFSSSQATVFAFVFACNSQRHISWPRFWLSSCNLFPTLLDIHRETRNQTSHDLLPHVNIHGATSSWRRQLLALQLLVQPSAGTPPEYPVRLAFSLFWPFPLTPSWNNMQTKSARQQQTATLQTLQKRRAWRNFLETDKRWAAKIRPVLFNCSVRAAEHGGSIWVLHHWVPQLFRIHQCRHAHTSSSSSSWLNQKLLLIVCQVPRHSAHSCAQRNTHRPSVNVLGSKISCTSDSCCCGDLTFPPCVNFRTLIFGVTTHLLPAPLRMSIRKTRSRRVHACGWNFQCGMLADTVLRWLYGDVWCLFYRAKAFSTSAYPAASMQ